MDKKIDFGTREEKADESISDQQDVINKLKKENRGLKVIVFLGGVFFLNVGFSKLLENNWAGIIGMYVFELIGLIVWSHINEHSILVKIYKDIIDIFRGKKQKTS